MKRAVLQRIETGDQGTFGILITDDGSWFYSGELPWRDNRSNISCVPAGEYTCTFTYSPRFKRRLYLVGPVLNRSGIRKHSANLMGDASKGYKAQLNGCISLGEKLGWLDGQKAILVSQPAISKLERLMEGKPFILEIKDCG